MATGEADQTYVIQYLVETQQAIRSIANMEAQIAVTKTQMIDMANQTAAAMDVIAKKMKAQRYNELLIEYKVRTPDPIKAGKFLIDKDALAQAKAAYNEYAISVYAALKRISQDSRTAAKEKLSAERAVTKEQERLQRQIAAIEREHRRKAEQEEARLSQQKAAIWRREAKERIDEQKRMQKAEEENAKKTHRFVQDISAAMGKYAKSQRVDPLLNADVYHTEIERMKADLVSLKSTSDRTFKEIAEGMKRSFATKMIRQAQSPEELKTNVALINDFNRNMSTALREVEADFKKSTKAAAGLDGELRQKPKDAKGVQGAFAKLGSVSKYVFGTLLGVTAIQALRDIVHWMQQALKAGEDYSQSIFKLSTSVRALQRVGYNVTMKDTVALIEELSDKFSTFTQRQIVDGVGYVQLLTRNFGFSNEQMRQTFEIASTLSVVLGKDFNEAARETALFLSSGYAESMQRACLAVNRLTVAQEAQRMGIDKSYTALTEQERSMAALQLVYREIQPLVKEVVEYQDTEAGKIKDLESDYQDIVDTIGKRLIPVKVEFLKWLVKGINLLAWASGLYSKWMSIVAYALSYPYFYAVEAMKFWETALKGGVTSYDDFISGVQYRAAMLAKSVNQATDLMKPIDLEKLLEGKDLPESERGTMPLLSDGDAQKQIDIIERMYKDAAKLKREYEKDFAELGRELETDLGGANMGKNLDHVMKLWDQFFSDQGNLTVEKTEEQQTYWERWFGKFGSIVDEGLDEAYNIWQDYYDRLDEIDRKVQENIEDENRNYAQQRQDAILESQRAIEDANRKHREDELKAERDYQEKLRRLREQYLSDLEDALRERDALQVIRLMRKYQMDQEQLKREKDLEDQAREEDYRRELEDIARHREEIS